MTVFNMNNLKMTASLTEMPFAKTKDDTSTGFQEINGGIPTGLSSIDANPLSYSVGLLNLHGSYER